MKIIDKLFVNDDHYDTFFHKIVTIIDWMKKTIVIHIIVYWRTDVNYFQIFDQVLQVFRDVYKKKNFKNNSWRIYIALKQKRDDFFVVFFSKFRKLNNILQYLKIMFIDDFKNKILLRLRKALIIRQIWYISLFDMKAYLQNLNDDQRIQIIKTKRHAIMQIFWILWSNFFAPTTKKNYVVVIFVSRFIASTIIIFLKLIVNIFVISALNRSDDVSRDFCFIYYKIDHFIVDCFDNSLKNARVNEIELKNFNDENSKNV